MVNSMKVGVAGLDDLLEEAGRFESASDEEVADWLLAAIAEKNYVPPAAKESYREALLREYKKSQGREVEEPRPRGLEIKVVGPGCNRCEDLFDMAMRAVAELGLEAGVEHVRDISEIAALGVVQVPALVADGKVLFAGRVPDFPRLKESLSGLGRGADGRR